VLLLLLLISLSCLAVKLEVEQAVEASFTDFFVDEVILEVIEDDVHKSVRDEMEVEICRRSDESCKNQTKIAALRDELSNCYATINE